MDPEQERCDICGTVHWIQEVCPECERRFYDEWAGRASRRIAVYMDEERSRIEPTEDEWITKGDTRG